MGDETQTNIENLARLSAFLRVSVPPPEFSMETFISERRRELPADRTGRLFPRAWWKNPGLYSDCGTVACAVGHGPLAGIEPLERETWAKYSERVFGVSIFSESFSFLFGDAWTHYDNTPIGAADRIDRYLENGCRVPDNWRIERAR